MADDYRVEAAIAEGRRQAAQVLEDRDRRTARRGARAGRGVERAARPVSAPERRAALGPPGSRVLLAEGDSWFDYPFSDVLKELEDNHDCEVESVSRHGHTIEQMAYSGGQLDEFVRRLEKLIRNGKTPEAILLSGGGNDVAGEEFAMLLNHANSPEAGLNEQVVAGVLEDRVFYAYITILSEVTAICERDLGAAIPILLHGYGYGVPDGRGFWTGWGFLPGPWLEPGFLEKGYEDLDANKAIVVDLIDRFNELLIALPAASGMSHVRHVDLRPLLPSDDAVYEDWWADELHPTELGFKAVAEKFVEVLDQ